MPKILASILSYLFHPLVLTTYIFGLLLFQFPELVYAIREEFKIHFVGSIFIMTFIVPGLSAFVLWKTGSISSLKMETIKERRYPFLFTFLIYAVDTFFFYKIFQRDMFFAVILGFVAITMLLVAIISLKWKISAHAAGLGGLVAFYIIASLLNTMQFDMVLCIAILIISGLTISARLALNSHNLMQVVAGFLLGLFTGLSSLLFLL